jgi:hypothetical protein
MSRLDWRLMQNGPVALYFRAQILDEDLHWLKEHGYRLFDFDCSTWATRDDFYSAVYVALGFPEPVKGNLNGLNDYLSQVEVPKESGCALAFRRFDLLATDDPEFAHGILDTIADNSRRKMLFGERFFAMIQSNDAMIRFDLVGAQPATWKHREWLNSKRGL